MKGLLKREFIGTYIEIIDSKNRALIGIKGRVVDETKNMLTIDTEKGFKKIIKSECRILLGKDENKIIIDGKKIAKRAEDRISMKE